LRRGITGPAAALTALLAPDVIRASVPPALAAATVRSAAALLIAGRLAAAAVPSAVAALVGGVLRRMFFSRLLTTACVLIALTTLLGGAAATWGLTRALKAPPPASADLAPLRSRLEAVRARRALLADAPGKPALRLPVNPDEVVLHMHRSVESSRVPWTTLSVYADGRVVAEVPSGLFSLSATELTTYARQHAGDDRGQNRSVLEGKLAAWELEELLRFALHDQEFFAFDQAAVKAAIRKQYHSDGIVHDNNDATTTVFRIQTADHSHEVRWSRLDRTLWDFPEVQCLRQLYAVQRELAQVFYVLLAGGWEQVEAVAAKMDTLLQMYYFHHPDVPRLDAADLSAVIPAPDGSKVRYAFSRYDDKNIFRPRFEVAIDVPQQGQPNLAYLTPPSSATRRLERLLPAPR
jgi:hypothetical protein